MPIYEYHCKSCGKDFEKMESITKESRTSECPHCKGEGERKVSAGSYHLTGSGFYNTDKKSSVPSCPTGSCCSGGSCGIQ